MRLLGGKKKTQYEANLRQNSGCHLGEKKNVDKSFKSIEPASVSLHNEEKRVRFWPMFVRNWHVTMTYCLVFWSFGMCVAFLGPTLADLGCRTETPFAMMSWIFFAQALFTLLGSVLGGVLVQRVMDAKPMLPGLRCIRCVSGEEDWRTSAHGAMLVSLVMLAVTLSLVPECWSLSMLALDLAVMGLFMGIIDTIANLCMIQLYGSNVAPFLQALHFFYALGAFASPMINEPFLLSNPHRCFELIDQLLDEQSSGNNTETERDLFGVLKTSEIQYGFWIMALLQVPVMVLVISLIARRGRRSEADEVFELGVNGEVTVHHGTGTPAEQTGAASPRQVVLVTLLVILLCFMYDGLQGAYGGYIYSYATAMIDGLDPTEAAYLNSCFWGTFAIGRLISIGVATKLSPAFMIVFNIVGCGLAAALMLTWQHSLMTVYVGTCLFGFSLSSVYPTAISLAENYINVTSLITSMIVVGAAAGEMVQPVIVGHEFVSVGPVMFLVNILLVVLSSVLVVFSIVMVGASIRRQTGVLRLFSCCAGDIMSGEGTGLVEPGVRYYSHMSTDASVDSFQVAAPAGRAS